MTPHRSETSSGGGQKISGGPMSRAKMGMAVFFMGRGRKEVELAWNRRRCSPRYPLSSGSLFPGRGGPLIALLGKTIGHNQGATVGRLVACLRSERHLSPNPTTSNCNAARGHPTEDGVACQNCGTKVQYTRVRAVWPKQLFAV